MDAMLDQNCTDEEQNAERDLCEEYRDKLRLMKLKVNKILDKSPASPTVSEYSTASGGPRRNFKLPKLEL